MLKLPRNAQLWLPGYVRARARARAARRGAPAETLDILFCIADHFEPDHGNADYATQDRRVARWIRDYPRLSTFRDADGQTPQHSFFSPLEVYRPQIIDALTDLCARKMGEVEVHLHHGHDTSDNVRMQLRKFRDTLAARHGLLGRTADGSPAYGFVHGNWALDNGGAGPEVCGVNDEITILRETGCYADFTMPAAPDPAQSRTVNAIYYAIDDPERPRSYDSGVPVQVKTAAPERAFMIIQGPLALTWDGSLRPRIDNGALDASPFNRPTLARFRRWVDMGVSVHGRPEWVFVKVHTHGAKEQNADVLLGQQMHEFHRQILEHYNDGARYRLHYVTAREMYNIARAAEAGLHGNAGLYRDYEIARPPVTGELHRAVEQRTPALAASGTARP